jgi:uncharacterized protein YbgA (DUF1722 family)/uncharacterized protein YbbK (DUF523 family)
LKEFAKPEVVLSKCIEFEKCRYDGRMISSDFVKKLISHVKFIPVCPEVEIGLGTPRNTLRIVSVNGELRLIQSATGLDVTEKMRSFADDFLNSLPEVDGFILKSRSPTSAFKDARIYSSVKKGSAVISKGSGLFGNAVLQRFAYLAIEDEGRLRNPRIKEHFLTKLFTLASFRKTKAADSFEKLVQFHSENKLLLKAYNQKETKALGRIVANRKSKPFDKVIGHYRQRLFKALKRPPRCRSNLNVMMNTMGYFSSELSKEEKTFFLDSLQKYKNGILPFSVNISILRLWIEKYKEDYLLKQTFFEPYPQELMDIDAMTVYCDGKDYWK